MLYCFVPVAYFELLTLKYDSRILQIHTVCAGTPSLGISIKKNFSRSAIIITTSAKNNKFGPEKVKTKNKKKTQYQMLLPPDSQKNLHIVAKIAKASTEDVISKCVGFFIHTVSKNGFIIVASSLV